MFSKIGHYSTKITYLILETFLGKLMDIKKIISSPNSTRAYLESLSNDSSNFQCEKTTKESSLKRIRILPRNSNSDVPLRKSKRTQFNNVTNTIKEIP